MYNKFKKIFKIYSIVLFVFLLLASNQSYAWNVDDEIERFYEEVETEDGVFYKRKKSSQSKIFGLSYNCTYCYNHKCHKYQKP